MRAPATSPPFTDTKSPPSQPSLPDHPFLALRVVAAVRILALLLLLVCLVTILGTCLCLVALRICLCLCRVRSGRGLPSAFRLANHGAVSITRSRDERYNTALVVLTSSALGAAGQLETQLLRTCTRRSLGNMTQYEDK